MFIGYESGSLPPMAMWSCTAEPLGGINSWWRGWGSWGCWKGQRHVCEQHKGPFSAHRSRTMRPDLGGDANKQTNRVSAVTLYLGGSSSPLLLRLHVLIQLCAAKTSSCNRFRNKIWAAKDKNFIKNWHFFFPPLSLWWRLSMKRTMPRCYF